jgi:hypothetical protein
MNSEKIQELIEKMQMRRNAIWKDVETHSHTLSAPAQVHLIAEVTKIDTYIVELQGQLDDMQWDSFIQSLWEREYEDGTAKDQ